MPRWNNQFRTAALDPAINTYKEGYHHGDHLGLSNVDTDLIPFNIWEYVEIFGVQGVMVWGGILLPVAEIFSSYNVITQAIAQLKAYTADSLGTVLTYETCATWSPEITAIDEAALVTIAQAESLVADSTDTVFTWERLCAVGGAIADDGGSLTDQTTAANEATANDMTLLPSGAEVGDAYDFGYASTFDGIRLKQETVGVGTWTITWKYWNGAWVDLSVVTDELVGFRPALIETGKLYKMNWDIPGDWALKTISGKNLYWVRAEVTLYTALTTQPKGTQAWIEVESGT